MLAVVALTTLVSGIGVTTAIFSFVNAVLLQLIDANSRTA